MTVFGRCPVFGEIVKAKAVRNRAVERLRLKARNDPWVLDVPVQEIERCRR